MPPPHQWWNGLFSAGRWRLPLRSPVRIWGAKPGTDGSDVAILRTIPVRLGLFLAVTLFLAAPRTSGAGAPSRSVQQGASDLQRHAGLRPPVALTGAHFLDSVRESRHGQNP